MIFRSPVVFCLVALSSLVGLCQGSSGDRSRPFQECLRVCALENCSSDLPPDLPLALRLTRWSCIDNCKYDCTHDATDVHLREIASRVPGARVHQFYGKWAFWRVMGMQEPASVLFSLLNLWAHWRGGRQFARRVKAGHPMRPYIILLAVVSINAWLWSAVFHTRDTPITEKLDYFSAALVIIYSLFVAVVRLFHLYSQPKLYLQQPTFYQHKSSLYLPRHTVLPIWALICALAFSAHVTYLSLLPRFDYSYNVIFNLVVGSAHNILWLLYSFKNSPIRRFENRPHDYLPSYGWKPAALSVLTTLATTLELFDFPPWGRVIDAHSLWHLATVPIVRMWYSFLIQDSNDEAWRVAKL